MKSFHSGIRLSIAAIIGIMGLSYAMLSHAASGDDLVIPDAVPIPAGIGSISIEEDTSSGALPGKWTLAEPDSFQDSGSSLKMDFTNKPTGNYTFFATVPDGGSVSLRLYRNGALENMVARPQINFKVFPNDTIRINALYTLTRVGLVSVESDPPGLDFTLTGPNATNLTGTTPHSFDGVAEGQYTVRYTPLSGCPVPPLKSLQLLEGSRVTFTITVSCAAADNLRKRTIKDESNTNVNVSADGGATTLRDVPQTAWFAPYVFSVARHGILTGYKDANGNPTGDFGPDKFVTVAELAKIAHKIGGVSEQAYLTVDPENPAALHAWYSPFIASAEHHGWTIFAAGSIDPSRPVTRGEALVTLMQALDQPLHWQKGDVFTDVTTGTPYAAAIETAAADKTVEGRKDATGNDLHLFGPMDPINRAEMAKMIATMLTVYKGVEAVK